MANQRGAKKNAGRSMNKNKNMKTRKAGSNRRNQEE